MTEVHDTTGLTGLDCKMKEDWGESYQMPHQQMYNWQSNLTDPNQTTSMDRNSPDSLIPDLEYIEGISDSRLGIFLYPTYQTRGHHLMNLKLNNW